MSYVVVSRLQLTAPVDDIAERIRRALPPAAESCPGFERYDFVKVADDRAVVVMQFSDEHAADEAQGIIGPAVYTAVLAPNLASEPDRDMGDVVFAYPA